MADKRSHRTIELDGERVAELMLKRGWTIETLASKAILSGGSISAVIRGTHPCNWSTALKLQAAFKLDSIDELLPHRESSANSNSDRIHEWLLDGPLSSGVTASNHLLFRIWRLRHEHLNKYARGKCYDLQGMASAERERCRTMLLRHAEVCTRIGSHPHVIKNLTTCEAPSVDRWWVIDEWVEGTTLEERMREPSHVPKSTKTVIQQTADALSALHSHGIVRRELSPRTVLILRESDDVVLTEFELAKLLDGSPTVSSAEWPVDPYRAPEAASDEIGRQADIYSWGRIAIHLLLGELPEKGTEAKPIKGIKLQKEIETLLLKCVAVSWRSRPSSFEDVLRIVDAWK